ncbi:hypothetical protein VNO78_15238 [Psophocarpus tetragonolobus]|uniref:Uncharacterized protein n=1 Tax=Psophocarpus tetragonolobus TaxID=3891 RepID=A0AAN9SID9_PSOTE
MIYLETISIPSSSHFLVSSQNCKKIKYTSIVRGILMPPQDPFMGDSLPIIPSTYFILPIVYTGSSQDPLMGLIKEAKSLNKGNCLIVSTSSLEVYKAYLKQFQKGFKLFLKSRSEELVLGGINECDDNSLLDGNIRAEFIATYTRAAMVPLLSAKFEAEIINELFIRLQKKLVQIMKVEKFETANLMISMTKQYISQKKVWPNRRLSYMVPHETLSNDRTRHECMSPSKEMQPNEELTTKEGKVRNP